MREGSLGMAFTNECLYRAHPAPATPAAGDRVILAATSETPSELLAAGDVA
jgi:hypothetical protein